MSPPFLRRLPLLAAMALLAGPAAQAGTRRHVPREPAETLDAAARGSRQRSIAMLEEMLRKGEFEGDKRATMILRLAEMYAYEARTEKLDAIGTWTEACDASPEDCPEQADLQAFEHAHDRALSLYRTVVAAHPRFARVPEARFALALGLLERERPADARDELRQYVRNHPEAPQAHLAWLQLGELELDGGRASSAVQAFRRSAGFPDGEYRATAEHRLGWALKNVGEDRRALDAVRRAVQLAEAAGDQALIEEGRKDLVRFAVELGELDEIESLLGQGAARVQALTLAARTHAEQGEVDKAVQVWRRVIAEAPEHPERPAAVAAITAEFRGQGRWFEALDAARRLEVEHRSGTAWARANAVHPPTLLEARERADRELRRIAIGAHTESRKLKRRPGGAEAAAAADGAYKSWLGAFGESDAAAGVHRAYGELLYEQGAFELAYDQYKAVWTRAPDSAGARQSTVDALHTAERLLEARPAPRPAADIPLATVEPRPLTTEEVRLLEAVDASLAIGSEHEAAVLYRAAYTLYNAFHFEEAATRFRKVIALDPGSADAEKAAHLIADMLAIRESWQALAENATFYANQPELGDARFREAMRALARKAELKQVESALAQDGDRRRAALDTLAWVDRHRESAAPEVMSLALRDAAAHWEAVEDPASARDVRRRFLDEPRLADDPARQDQWLALGDDLERLAQWEEAAIAYGEGAALGGDDRRIAEALWRRALLLEAAESPRAPSAFTAFIERFSQDERVVQARVRRARAEGSVRAWSLLLDDPDLSTAIRLEAALAMHRLGQRDAVSRGIALLPDPIPVDAAELAGELRFLDLTEDFKAFRARELTLPPAGSSRSGPRHLARQITQMQREARALSERTQAVMATRSGRWGLAAAVRIGEIQEIWARILDESPTPTHLTEDQAVIYRQKLADVIWHRREQARIAYIGALERAWDLTLYTDATAVARQRLSVLAPEDWPPMHERIELSWRLAEPRKEDEVETLR